VLPIAPRGNRLNLTGGKPLNQELVVDVYD